MSNSPFISFSQFFELYTEEMAEVRSQLKEIIASISSLSSKMDSLEERLSRTVTINGFKSLETKTESYSEKVINVEEKLEEKVEHLDEKIDLLCEQTNLRVSSLEKDLKDRVSSVERKTQYLEESIDRRIGKIEGKIDQLQKDLNVVLAIPLFIVKIFKAVGSLFKRGG
jgi:predicted  nucleic acid-binding Zn-ribbon protein